jgi:hypothetical protein
VNNGIFIDSVTNKTFQLSAVEVEIVAPPNNGPSYLVPVDADNLLIMRQGQITLLRQLHHINFTSRFLLTNDSDGAPMLQISNDPRDPMVDAVWTPQEGQDTYLIVDPGNGNAMLLSFTPKSYEAHMPGVPNVFRHGRLCLGEMRPPPTSMIKKDGLLRWADAWIKAWGKSPWNRDLFPSDQNLCTFDPTITPITNRRVADWTRCAPYAQLGAEDLELIKLLKTERVFS